MAKIGGLCEIYQYFIDGHFLQNSGPVAVIFFTLVCGRRDGTTCSKRSIQAIRYAVQRHYFDEQGVDICDKSTFPKSNKVFKAVLVKLKREGKGNVRHKDAVTPADMEKIQNCDDLDCNTPAGLQNKVFIDLMMYFCNRGREFVQWKPRISLYKLMRMDVITWQRETFYPKIIVRMRTSHSTGLMFEVPTSEKCPFKCNLTYISKLNDKCPFLWQKPKREVPNEGEPWYYNCAIGVNTIANKMKTNFCVGRL